MIGEVIVVKLVNDEHYIGVLSEEDEQGVRIESPMRLFSVYAKGTANYDIMMLPWSDFSSKNDVYLDKLHVLYYTVPREDVLRFYKKSVGKPVETSAKEEYSHDPEVLHAIFERLSSNNTTH